MLSGGVRNEGKETYNVAQYTLHLSQKNATAIYILYDD